MMRACRGEATRCGVRLLTRLRMRFGLGEVLGSPYTEYKSYIRQSEVTRVQADKATGHKARGDDVAVI